MPNRTPHRTDAKIVQLLVPASPNAFCVLWSLDEDGNMWRLSTNPDNKSGTWVPFTAGKVHTDA